MESFLSVLASLHDPQFIESLIQTGGLFILVLIVFAETGLLLGFFLPGDSLLLTAGYVASQSLSQSEQTLLNIYTLNVALVLAAFIGDQLGYLLGKKTGPRIFNREDGRLFKKKHVKQAHEFYEKYGPVSLILARFVPICRTFVPYIAGVVAMSYRKYILFSFLGAFIWINSLTLIGYFLGKSELGNQLHFILLIVIGVSVLPLLIGTFKQAFKNKKE